MHFFPLPPLVPTGWLAERLGHPGLVILDTSWHLPSSGRDARAEYRDGHVPGALYFDLDEASDRTTTLPHMLPGPDAFAAYAGSFGIDAQRAVVVYDTSGSNLSAARAWWMFRVFGHEGVALLDGGLGKWRAEGRPMQRGPAPAVRPAAFEARLDRSRVLSLDAVRAMLESGGAQVVDARSTGRFRGVEPEPRPGIPSGHMPGAVNLPYTDLVRADGTALDEDELRGLMARTGIRLDVPIVATCGSGTSACNLLLALHRLGVTNATLYDGSWTEWVSRGQPVARGGP